MNVKPMIDDLDKEILKLQTTRAVLVGLDPTHGAAMQMPPRKLGRPKGSKNAVAAPSSASKRHLSPEGRARISKAMKARWAAKHRATKKAMA